MKSKLKMRSPAVVLTLITALTMVSAVAARAADNKNVVTPAAVSPAPTAIDPSTGLPMSTPAQWKDANWKDPDVVLKEVLYDALPLEEVARNLRKQFDDAFDVLIPHEWRDPTAER